MPDRRKDLPGWMRDKGAFDDRSVSEVLRDGAPEPVGHPSNPMKRIDYADLDSRQRENYNITKLGALLADYGYHCMILTADWHGADLIAHHVDGHDKLIQVKSRFTLREAYTGKDLWVAFPHDGQWYLFPHDQMQQAVAARNPKAIGYSWRRPPTCGNTVGARRVEEHVWSLIFDSILAEDAPRSWIRVTAGVLREDRGDAEAAVVEFERLLRGLATERLNLDRQLVREAITEANHAALAAENTGERVVVEAQLAEASARLEAAADVDAWEDQAHTFVDRAAELSVTPAGRLEIHRALIRSVLVWRGEDGEAHFDVDWRVNVTEPATRSSASIST